MISRSFSGSLLSEGAGQGEESILALVDRESTIARMIKRRLHDHLTYLIGHYPAVVLLGPRQVGKTTLALELAKSRPSVYVDLESAADRKKLTDPELYLAHHTDKPVTLDEVQRQAPGQIAEGLCEGQWNYTRAIGLEERRRRLRGIPSSGPVGKVP